MRFVSSLLRALSLLCVAFAFGCTSAKVSPIGTLRPLATPVNRLAFAPSGGILADAVGVALLNSGFDVLDTQQTSNLLIRHNLSELELIQPESLGILKDRGVDAIVFVRTAAGADARPQSASVRVISTVDGSLVAGASWQNGSSATWMAEPYMRKGVVEAADQIARVITQHVQRPAHAQ